MSTKKKLTLYGLTISILALSICSAALVFNILDERWWMVVLMGICQSSNLFSLIYQSITLREILKEE